MNCGGPAQARTALEGYLLNKYREGRQIPSLSNQPKRGKWDVGTTRPLFNKRGCRGGNPTQGTADRSETRHGSANKTEALHVWPLLASRMPDKRWRMPRGPRLDIPGALHHVIVRGIDRQNIFLSDADRNGEPESLVAAWK